MFQRRNIGIIFRRVSSVRAKPFGRFRVTAVSALFHPIDGLGSISWDTEAFGVEVPHLCRTGWALAQVEARSRPLKGGCIIVLLFRLKGVTQSNTLPGRLQRLCTCN